MGRFKILYEAVSLNVIRKYYGYWDKSFYDEWFGRNVYRIYLDADGSRLYDETIFNDSAYKKIEKLLYNNGYVIENWKAGLAKKIGDDKNLFKIGKLLGRFDSEIKKIYDLMRDKTSKLIDSDPNNLLIVISRHPYDIIGMSSDREWKSCLQIDNRTGELLGSASKSLVSYIKENGLIAYLIKNDDKNIQNPLGRLLIYPYKDDDGNVFLYPAEKGFGKISLNMRNIILHWLNKKQKNMKKMMNSPSGMYTDINPRLLYSNIDEFNDKLKKYGFNLKRTIKVFQIKNPEGGLNKKGGYFLNDKYFLNIKNENGNFFHLYDVKTKELLFHAKSEEEFIDKIININRG